jgi:phytoene/squalene synthetase
MSSLDSATATRSGKGHRDENFPVASHLIHPRHRGAILAFYNFVRAGDDVADHAELSPERKLELLDRLADSLTGAGSPRGGCRRAMPWSCSTRSGWMRARAATPTGTP